MRTATSSGTSGRKGLGTRRHSRSLRLRTMRKWLKKRRRKKKRFKNRRRKIRKMKPKKKGKIKSELKMIIEIYLRENLI